MQTSGPENDGKGLPPAAPADDAQSRPGLPPAGIGGGPTPRPNADANRGPRSTGEKIGIAILIIAVGIPVGLFIFGALLFGACMLGSMTDDWRELLGAVFGIVLGCGLSTAVVEMLWLRRKGELSRARLREMAMSLSAVPPNLLFSFATAGTWAALFTTAHAFAPSALPVNAWTVVAAVIAVDFSYYWEHRCAHRVPVLWRLYHAVHHSSPDYTVATAYRVSFLNQLFSPAFYLPWVLLGFHPLLVVALQQIAFHYQAWLHTEAIGGLGWIDRWFNTPASHRMHHSSAPEHRDRNLGAITLLWDRAFGTFARPVEGLYYGIGNAAPPRGWLALYLDPLLRRRPSEVRDAA